MVPRPTSPVAESIGIKEGQFSSGGPAMVSRHDAAPSTPARLGGFAWLLVLLWFPVQALVQTTYAAPFDWTRNGLGDLGAAQCTTVATPGFGQPHPVCSPWHEVMNASTAAVGVLGLLALVLTRRELWARGSVANLGVGLMALSLLGKVVSGAVPEDVHEFGHFAGAALDLGVAPLALLVLGLTVRSERLGLAMFTSCLGAVALLGVVLGIPLGLGAAGAERLGAYPVLVWMVGMGVLVFDRTLRVRRHSPAPI